MDNSNQILYYSTNLKAPGITFYEALLQGLAPDKGLYMPEKIPVLSPGEMNDFKSMAYHEIAYTILNKYLAGQIPNNELENITRDAYNYPVPLEQVYERKYVMRLDQGPTASFKDFAARVMGRLMQYFLQRENKNLLILTATSGDTGSAIANAFYGLDNIKVAILYPENEVTDIQRKQMTTLKKNVQIIAIDGKFDDCQALVKDAFVDPDLRYLNLSSANSINIGRLLPQSIFYVYAWSKLKTNNSDEVIFSVPSGNFGNLMGGLIAHQMGLKVKRFVVSTNENDEVPTYHNTGIYQVIYPSRNCISSAMNVGHPSNMSRIISLYGGIMNEKGEIIKEPDLERIRKDMVAFSVTDEETKNSIRNAYERYKLLLEPHGAVAWEGLQRNFDLHTGDGLPEQLSISVETAHPAKFPEEIEKILGIKPQLPDSLQGLDEKEESFVKLDNTYNTFKGFLKDNY